MNELYESAVHHFLMQDMISQQRNLIRVQLLHRIGRQFSAYRIINRIHNRLKKYIHPFFSCFLQNVFFEFYFHHTLQRYAIRLDYLHIINYF